MLSVKQLPIDIKGLTPEMAKDLEARILEFEKEHESSTGNGGAGYVPMIKKKDFAIAGIVNGAIVLYYIIAVLVC